MASVFGAAGGGRFKITSPPEIKQFKIHLHKTRSEEGIFGKVKICNDSTIQHYGLVVELQGTIILPDEKIIKVFAPDRNSPFVFKSSVYDHITGEQDAMKRAAPSADHKRTSNGGTVYPFSLKIPNTAPLPESFSFHNIKVEYKIILYQRKEFGYVLLEEIPVNFQGYHFIHGPPNPNPEDPNSVAEVVYNVGDYSLNDGITLQLKTVKACLTNEDIFFTVTIKNPTTETCQSGRVTVKRVEVKLMRHMKYQRAGDEFSDSVVVNSFSRTKNWTDDEISVQGKLKKKLYMPSYPGEHGFRIDYFLECEVTTSSQEFNTSPGLEVIIGTAGSPGLNSGTENELSAPGFSRPRSGSRSSIFSFLPPAYSQLSSRAASFMSLLSFQSLPPHYSDVVEDVDKDTTVEK